nr:uncharacterized protein LOC128706147 [Cherax quadricarinatus]
MEHSASLHVDLIFLKIFVLFPTLDEMEVVLNTTTMLIKQAQQQGWAKLVDSVCSCLQLLHHWHVSLSKEVAKWPQTLVKWCHHISQSSAGFPVLEKTLVLVQDFLLQATPMDAGPWLLLLLDVFRSVCSAWTQPAYTAQLVSLSAVTSRLITILHSFPTEINSEFRKSFLEQLMPLVDDGDTCLPGNTLVKVTQCVCWLLSQADPPQMLWVINTFSTPHKIMREIDQAHDDCFQRCPGVEVKATIVTELLQVLNHFTLAVFMQTVRMLSYRSEVPHLEIVCRWFCEAISSGLSFDASNYFATGEDGKVTSFLEHLVQKFQRRSDILYLQVLTYTLMNDESSRNYMRESNTFLATLKLSNITSAITRGAAVLLAFLLASRDAFCTFIADCDRDEVTHDVYLWVTEAPVGMDRKFVEVLRSAAKEVLLLLGDTCVLTPFDVIPL